MNPLKKPATGSVQLKNKYWHTVINAYVGGVRKQVWQSTYLPERNNKRKAQDILAQRLAAYNDGGLHSLKTLSKIDDSRAALFSGYLKRWLERKAPTVAPRTRDGYEQLIEGRIKRYFDGIGATLGSVTSGDFYRFLDELQADGLSGKTQQRYYGLMKQALDDAVKRELIDRNPLALVDRPKAQKYKPDFLISDELIKLLDFAKSDPMYALIATTVYYGLRRSEVVALKWEHVDFVNKTLAVENKAYEENGGGKTKVIITDRLKTEASRRKLPLLPDIEVILLKEKERQRLNRKAFGKAYCKKYKDFCFVNPLGKLFTPHYVSSHFSLVLKKAGVRHVRFHDLRHTCASVLVAAGVPIPFVSKYLGHAQISTTSDIYTHLSYDAQQSAGDAMQLVMSGGKSEEE